MGNIKVNVSPGSRGTDIVHRLGKKKDNIKQKQWERKKTKDQSKVEGVGRASIQDGLKTTFRDDEVACREQNSETLGNEIERIGAHAI